MAHSCLPRSMLLSVLVFAFTACFQVVHVIGHVHRGADAEYLRHANTHTHDTVESRYWVDRFEFGVDANFQAWFRVESKDVTVEERNLKYVADLFGETKESRQTRNWGQPDSYSYTDGTSQSHRSSTFQKFDGKGFSLVIHSNDCASLTILDGNTLIHVSPTHHIHLDSLEHEEIKAQAERDLSSSVTRHLVTRFSNDHPVFNFNSSCGGLEVVEDVNGKIDPKAPPGLPGKKKKKRAKLKDIEIDHMSKSKKVKPIDKKQKRKGTSCKGSGNPDCEENKKERKKPKRKNCTKKNKNKNKNKGKNKNKNKNEPDPEELDCDDESDEVEGEGEGRSLLAKVWDNCRYDQTTARIMEIGIMVDLGFYQSYGSDTGKTMEALEIMVANSNLVLYYHTNVMIRVRQVIIVTEEISDVDGGPFGPIFSAIPELLSSDPYIEECTTHDILTSLDSLKTLVQSSAHKQLDDVPTIPQSFNDLNGTNDGVFPLSHWHLLTNCFPMQCLNNEDGCTVGVAYSQRSVGTICTNSGVGVTSRTEQTWTIFLHELGHNLGMGHSFEEDPVHSGGIMGYDNGKYLGEYQFNEKYRKSELCDAFNNAIDNNRCRKEDENQVEVDLFPAYTPDCTLKEDREPCAPGDVGMCLNRTCVPVEPRVRVEASGLVKDYYATSAVFGPMSVYSNPIESELAIADPVDLCNLDDYDSNSSDIAGKIVLIKRSGCKFIIKAENAVALGAIGVIMYNHNPDEDASPMFGIGVVSIPMTQITLAAGQEILAMNNPRAYIGGFPALQRPRFVSLARAPSEEEEPNLEDILIGCFGSIIALCAIYLGYDFYKGARAQSHEAEAGHSVAAAEAFRQQLERESFQRFGSGKDSIESHEAEAEHPGAAAEAFRQQLEREFNGSQSGKDSAVHFNEQLSTIPAQRMDSIDSMDSFEF